MSEADPRQYSITSCKDKQCNIRYTLHVLNSTYQEIVLGRTVCFTSSQCKEE